MATKSRVMSGPFILRDAVDTDGTTFTQTSLDISGFVNALNGEVLRIKQVFFEWTSDNGGAILGTDVSASGPDGASANAQLTSDSNTTIQPFTNVGMIAKNNIYAHVDSTESITNIYQDSGLNPYDFEDGYLVATDTLYLAVNQNSSPDNWASNIRVSVLMECEIVKLSLEDAQAVLVSQTLG